MKLVEGRHLFNILNDEGKGGEQAFGILRLLNVFQSLCMALSFAHSKGVVHRDVKPENVLVGEHGEVYLTDWGIAKLLNSTQESMFSGEGIVATIPSPENIDSCVLFSSLAIPQSVRYTSPCSPTRTFSGFTSLCTTPFEWAKLKAMHRL